MGFSRQEYCSGLPCPSSGDLPDPEIEPTSLAAPALQVNCLPPSHQGSLHFCLLLLFNHVKLYVIPWPAACQASLSITNSRSLLKLTSIESVMPSNHLILCHPCLLPPSRFPASGSFLQMSQVFSNESGQSIGVSASASVLPMDIQDWFPLGWTG